MADSKMPAKIRVAQDADGFWTCREAVSGSPEFIRADLVEPLVEALRGLVEAKALSGVRDLVAGWNGENRADGPYKERHPSQLGATLPKTNCGDVYALDEAMQRANAALSSWEAAQ